MGGVRALGKNTIPAALYILVVNISTGLKKDSGKITTAMESYTPRVHIRMVGFMVYGNSTTKIQRWHPRANSKTTENADFGMNAGTLNNEL